MHASQPCTVPSRCLLLSRTPSHVTPVSAAASLQLCVRRAHFPSIGSAEPTCSTGQGTVSLTGGSLPSLQHGGEIDGASAGLPCRVPPSLLCYTAQATKALRGGPHSLASLPSDVPEAVRLPDPWLLQALHGPQLPPQTCEGPLSQRASGAQEGKQPPDQQQAGHLSLPCAPLCA